MKKITKKDIQIALVVGLPVALVAAAMFHFGITYSDEVLIPKIALDNWETLSFSQQQAIMNSPDSFRVISGVEKVIYMLQAQPMTFIYYWLALAVPMCGAVVFGAWSVRRQFLSRVN